MAKLSLTANPSFKAKAGIPVAGGKSVDVEFVFRHRTKSQLDEFIKTRAEKSDADSLMDMATGWDLEDEFNQESVALLLENYIGAAVSVYRAYIDELVANRSKN
jgi:hypothetical protein